jgi:flagellar M-ring protein FliF
LDTSGRILSNTNEADQNDLKKYDLEKQLSNSYDEIIRRVLNKYLLEENYQLSVHVNINTDKKQINELIYNPDSRVERSSHIVKENRINQNNISESTIGVDKNIPNDKKNSDLKSDTENVQKQDELNNYELSTKSVNVISDSFIIDKISVAIVINKNSNTFKDKSEIDIKSKIQEIEELISAATGITKERGDTLKAVIAEFTKQDLDTLVSNDINLILLSNLINYTYPLLLLSLILIFIIYSYKQFSKIKSTQVDINNNQHLISDQILLTNNEIKKNKSEKYQFKDKLINLIHEDEEIIINIMKQWLRG